jgi:hypothetical protein
VIEPDDQFKVSNKSTKISSEMGTGLTVSTKTINRSSFDLYTMTWALKSNIFGEIPSRSYALTGGIDADKEDKSPCSSAASSIGTSIRSDSPGLDTKFALPKLMAKTLLDSAIPMNPAKINLSIEVLGIAIQ